MIRNGQETRLRMSNLLQQENHALGSIRSSGSRVTRNPMFHEENDGYAVDEIPDVVETNGPPGTPYEQKKSTSEYKKDRPYFLDKTTMTRLKQILMLAQASGTVPWRFNKETHRIDKWSPFFERLWKIQWFFVTIQTACLTCFQFYSFISRVETEIKTYREVFMNSVSVYWYVRICTCSICTIFHVTEFTESKKLIDILQ